VDDAPAAATPADLERRAVWLAVAAGLLLFLRSQDSFFFGTGHLHRQLWLFMLSTAALGGTVLLAGLVALPELVAHPARIATRWNPVRLYGWALALFVIGLVITAIAGIWAAADLLGNQRIGG
jgi:hypothetical protein